MNTSIVLTILFLTGVMISFWCVFLSSLGFHFCRWGKWRTRESSLYLWQIRNCKVCGKAQERSA